jgi:uncharacterized protein (TIGR00369 family)
LGKSTAPCGGGGNRTDYADAAVRRTPLPAQPDPRLADRAERPLTPAEVAALSGLDLLRGILDGRLPAPPICRTMSFRLAGAEAGRVVFEGEPGFPHFNPLGGVHGGWFGTLLDSCMGCAVHSLLPRGRGYATLEYKVNLLRAPEPGTGPLSAIGEATHVGRRTGVAEGRLVDARGRLYALGSTTCLIFDL